MRIKETLDQAKFPTCHLKDIGIEKISALESCIDNEPLFMEIIKVLCDKSIWITVTTRDLYYWINVLNKVDSILVSTLKCINELSSGTIKADSEQHFELLYEEQCQKLRDLVSFCINLLKESSSRSIYNSVDRLIEIINEVDDLELIYLSLEAIYTLIKKSCITGKFTKAHEVADGELLRLTYMLSQGNNFLCFTKLDLAESTDFEFQSNRNEIRIQRFNKIKKGSRDKLLMSYLQVTLDQLDAVVLSDNKQRTSKNLATHISNQNDLGSNLIAPLAMKILFAQKIRNQTCGPQSLVDIHKIMLKARSVFIHLSAAEETDTGYTSKFVKEFPFTIHIPQILSFCTLERPSILHCGAVEILHSYLCAAIAIHEGTNIYRQSASQIFASLGVANMSDKPIHKMLHDCASLRLRRVNTDSNDGSSFDVASYELISGARFVHSATAQCSNFIDIFLDIILLIVTHFKSAWRGNVGELMKIIDAQPSHMYYTFTLGQTAKAARILLSILKRNIEEFNTVERTIQRLTSEINILLNSKSKGRASPSDWRCIQCPNEVVHKSQRHELIRVLFRLLNSSVFKNDSTQGNFNPNFVSNSRKILDSGLFDTCLELFAENSEETASTHDVAMASCMHLVALVLNDLPAQIAKACEHLLPKLFSSLEARIPNCNGFFISLLKLIAAVTVHEKGRESLK